MQIINFLDILKEVNTLIKLNKAKNGEKINQIYNNLVSKVGIEHNENGIGYLIATLKALGLDIPHDDTLNVDVLDVDVSDNLYVKSFEHDFNSDLFKKILPLCQLAYLYESNGIPEEHALKLATIFTNENNIIQYLLYIGESGARYLLYDSCLFDLPDENKCNMTYWKKLANAKNKKITGGLTICDRNFRKMLPNAPSIENLILKGKKVRKKS